MKKLLVMLLALLLACGAILAGAAAEEQSPYTYTVKSSHTAELRCIDENIETAIIPAQIDGYWITSLAEDAFFGCTKLKKVVIPSTVKELGVCALSCCYSLKDLTIPHGVTTIKGQTFMYNIDMRSISIPSTVKKIGDGVFNYCDQLKYVRISRGNSYYETKGKLLIEKKTKRIVSSFGTINGEYTIPFGIKEIASVAFQGQNGMTVLTIPSTVKKIENLAFVNCDNLTCKVTLGSYAHKYCKDNGIPYIIAKK
ncbi:leucine-rich repeat domain-containing protein [Clostridiales bacterium FE2010]|nr:leucine-rich repeat domain-containing protein [Clostridiales bacterium FE2010]